MTRLMQQMEHEFCARTFFTFVRHITLCSVKTVAQNFDSLFSHKFFENFKRYRLIKKCFNHKDNKGELIKMLTG
jgi:hypothetical protein